MSNKPRSLLDLEYSDNKVQLVLFWFLDVCFLGYSLYYAKWTLKKLTHYGSTLILVFLFGLVSCVVPEPNGIDSSRPPIAPNLDIVPSNRERSAPPILGVQYTKTIGRTGQGPAEFLMPMGLALDAYQQLYVADAGNNRVQVVDTNGFFITEYGSYGWREGEFDFPNDVALNLDTLFVADTGNDRIQYCNLVNRIFYPLTTTLKAYEFDSPEGIDVGKNGDVYAIDTHNHRWLQFTRNLTPVFAMGSFGSSREQFWNPTDIVVNSHNTVFVVDSGNNSIKSYDFSGNPIHFWGEGGNALGQFRSPKRIALDGWNYLYITDSGNRRIQIFTPDGKAILEFSDKSLLNPCGIAVSTKGNVYVSDMDAGNIKVFRVIYKKDAEKTE